MSWDIVGAQGSGPPYHVTEHPNDDKRILTGVTELRPKGWGYVPTLYGYCNM